MNDKLDVLFHPKSVALVGASNTFSKWGFIIPACILSGGYQDKLYPVNPKEDTILGRKVYPQVSAIPDEVDLAIIVTPAPQVPAVIEDCGRKGVKSLVVITSDFSETGEEGAKAEEEIVALARKYDMPMVGPNSMGIVSTSPSLYAMMAPFTPQAGPISMASQSGNVGTKMMIDSSNQGVGVNKFASSGNEGDITICDYLEYFGQDPETKIIALYIEGIDDGQRFIELAKNITPKKPIIVLKGGRTRAGGKAAASHTGALAGSTAVYESMFRQCGIIQAYTTQEVVDFAYGFAACPLPPGRRVAILTRGGGWGVLSADFCEDMGLEVSPLPQPVVEHLDKVLPPYWSRGNPVDMVATLNLTDFGDALKLLLENSTYDSVIGLGISVKPVSPDLFSSTIPNSIDMEQMQAMQKFVSDAGESQVREIMTAMKQHQKPVILVGTPAELEPMENGTPINIFPDPERAVHILSAMVRYAEYRRSLEAQ